MRLTTWIGVSAIVVSAAACSKPLDLTHTTESYSSFGDLMYKQVCQRVAYTGELADKAAGTRTTIDVSGKTAHAVCYDGMPVPADATQKLKAVVPQKGVITKSVDLIVPKTLYDDTRAFLLAILPLHDDGTMEATMVSMGDLMADMRDDVDLGPALERIGARSGYRPLKHSPGMTPLLLNYTNVDDLLGKLLDFITDGGDGQVEWKALLAASSLEMRSSKYLDDPSDPERKLQLAINLLFSTKPELGTGKARWAVVRDFRGVAMVATVDGELPSPFADQDGDGLADIDASGRFVDASGSPIDVATPFAAPGVDDTAERDDDGRALVPGDTVPLYEYVDLDQAVLTAFLRDQKTLLDPDKNSLLGLLWGAGAMLGPRMNATKDYTDAKGKSLGTLAYNGHDTSGAAPLLDLAHAFVQLLGDPNLRDTLRAASTLVTKHESAATRAVKAMFDVNDLGKKYPNAKLAGQTTLFDDLAPIVARIVAVPGLTEDLVKALQNPHVRGLAPMIARQMQARNQVDFDHSDTFNWSFDAGSLDLVDNVDRTMTDSDYNRSLFQRIAHLIWEVNGTQFCNKDGATLVGFKIGPLDFSITRDKCQLFNIPDLGIFFVLLMASPEKILETQNDPVRSKTTYLKANFCEQITDTTMHDLLTTSLGGSALPLVVGIKNFNCIPTPAAATRSLFLEPDEQAAFMQNTTDPVRGRSGERFIDLNPKSIFAWETKLDSNPAGAINAAYYSDTFYDAIRPVVDAFVSHDECTVARDEKGVCPDGKLQNAGKILVDFLGMMHTHWPSPASKFYGGKSWQPDIGKPFYAKTDNAQSYEPLLIEVLKTSDMVPSVIDLAPILSTLTIDGTPSGMPALATIAKTARYVFDPAIQPAKLAYRNGTTTTKFSDGVTPGPRVTTYYLMADAYAAKKATLASIPTEQANAWVNATSQLVDLMLTVDKVENDQYQFHNRRVFAMTPILIDFLIGRIDAHRAAKDIEDWSHKTLSQDLADSIAGPMFTALTDLVDKVNGNVDLRNALYALLNYLFDETGPAPAFDTQLATLGDVFQVMLDDGNLVPITRSVGSALNPDKGAVDKQLTFMKKARAKDPKKVLLAILRNLYKVDERTLYPAFDVADVIAEMNRKTPGMGGRMLAADYQKMFSELNDFFTDEKRGFMRFEKIVQNRNLPE